MKSFKVWCSPLCWFFFSFLDCTFCVLLRNLQSPRHHVLLWKFCFCVFYISILDHVGQVLCVVCAYGAQVFLHHLLKDCPLSNFLCPFGKRHWATFAWSCFWAPCSAVLKRVLASFCLWHTASSPCISSKSWNQVLWGLPPLHSPFRTVLVIVVPFPFCPILK